MSILSRAQNIKAKCGKRAILTKSQTETGVKYHAKRLNCKSWLCPRCSKKMAARWSNGVKQYFNDSKLFMLTLTLDDRYSIADSYKHAPKAWNRLRLKITRKYGSIKYVRVLEVQPKSQRAHFHVICNIRIDKIWLAEALTESGWGIIYDFTECNPTNAYSYVRKYLKKPIPDGYGAESMYDCRARRISGGKGFFMAKFVMGFSQTIARNLPSSEIFAITQDIEVRATEHGFIVERETGYDGDVRLYAESIHPPGSEVYEKNLKLLNEQIQLLPFIFI